MDADIAPGSSDTCAFAATGHIPGSLHNGPAGSLVAETSRLPIRARHAPVICRACWSFFPFSYPSRVVVRGRSEVANRPK